ncbi:ataxin-3-like [Orussus abietinus]|uniref:ataxin-3-like n=1 Tax=Orussus abietinus TaxID=222816 RepID=UPI00062604A8|nr:ataxin-3-like [Orussus abietinus]
MDSIFHEKQEGYLCAQHCLNALLQGPYFNAVDLANLALQMDEEERIRMAESGIDSEDYKLFLKQPSGNMDDSGYFSVQVISSALKVWGLELIPYNSTEPTALMAQNEPSAMKAYICNYKGHWFTIRKLGNQWFNLNSMLSGPELISDTYLAMYLAQLLQEGYSIFIVIGTFPQCPSDDILLKHPVTNVPKTKVSTGGGAGTSKGFRLGTLEEEQSKIFEAARALCQVKMPFSADIPAVPSISSKMSFPSEASTSYGKQVITISDRPRERIIPIRVEGRDLDDEDEEERLELQRAVQLSLQDNENIDESLKLRLDLDNKTIPQSINLDDPDDDDELRKALQLSLECVTAPPTPDPDDLRWHRLAYLGIHSRTPNSEATPKLNT